MLRRKRRSFFGYAVELGLLPANPADRVQWRPPRAAVVLNPATVASPAQVRTILAQVGCVRPDLVAFFGCPYYAVLRPEEAVALRRDDLILPARGRGKMILTGACPRTGSAWTSTGRSHEPRGLKHRPDGAVRVVPIPAVLAGMLRQHLLRFGSGPDGRLFRGIRGGMLSESVYGRVWYTARQAALSPALATTALARRPYDLRHAALSLWLNASGAPAEVAARVGNSTHVPCDTYLQCLDSQDDIVSQQIEDALDGGTSSFHAPRCVTASGAASMQRRKARARTIYPSLPARLTDSFRPETIAPSPVRPPYAVSWERSSWASCPSANRTITVACPPTASR
ncbi:MAG: tyrosine-type recombinase/integrase [Streptosporangiaceae bacterium]